jgi:hypothetical protein
MPRGSVLARFDYVCVCVCVYYNVSFHFLDYKSYFEWKVTGY